MCCCCCDDKPNNHPQGHMYATGDGQEIWQNQSPMPHYHSRGPGHHHHPSRGAYRPRRKRRRGPGHHHPHHLHGGQYMSHPPMFMPGAHRMIDLDLPGPSHMAGPSLMDDPWGSLMDDMMSPPDMEPAHLPGHSRGLFSRGGRSGRGGRSRGGRGRGRGRGGFGNIDLDFPSGDPPPYDEVDGDSMGSINIGTRSHFDNMDEPSGAGMGMGMGTHPLDSFVEGQHMGSSHDRDDLYDSDGSDYSPLDNIMGMGGGHHRGLGGRGRRGRARGFF